jgi:hypothetical protein
MEVEPQGFKSAKHTPGKAALFSSGPVLYTKWQTLVFGKLAVEVLGSLLASHFVSIPQYLFGYFFCNQ